MKATKVIVLYHANCQDGFGAAWAAHKYLNSHNKINASYHYCSYGMPIDLDLIEEGSRVYMLDFSAKPEIIDQIAQKAELIILDHHETAQSMLSDYPKLSLDHNIESDSLEVEKGVKVRFDMSQSGAALAWKYFSPDEEVPLLIQHIQDRDLWEWKIENTDKVAAVLQDTKFDFDLYDQIHQSLESDPSKIYSKGSTILDYQETLVRQICRNTKITEWNGSTIAAVNSTVLFSEIGNYLMQKHCNTIDYAMVFNAHIGAGKFLASLRSTDQHKSVSEVAKQFGGGGHRNAAGFNILLSEGLGILAQLNNSTKMKVKRDKKSD